MAPLNKKATGGVKPPVAIVCGFTPTPTATTSFYFLLINAYPYCSLFNTKDFFMSIKFKYIVAYHILVCYKKII